MRTQSRIKIILHVVAISTLFVASAAHADFCPQIFPCDADNELNIEYVGQNDECALKFDALCRKLRAADRQACSDLSGQYNTLQEKFESLQKQTLKLKKTVKSLRGAKR